MRLTFLGAAGTVTGSKTLVECDGRKVMVDCGLFQGLKALRLRNRAPLPVAPADLDSVVLTHAHLDHSGYLPLLVKNGFKGPVYTTDATGELCAILLPDSGHLQEQDAEYANRQGFSKHKPALPLYTRADAEDCLESLRGVAEDQSVDLGHGLSLRFRPGGHILGAAQACLTQGGCRVLFSGDVGRRNDPVMYDPTPGGAADYVVVESTYGGRHHGEADPEAVLAAVVNRTASRGGTIVIPSFAVGRAQSLMYHLMRLKDDGRIPDLPVFLDSPMAIDVSELFIRFHRLHRLDETTARRLGRSIRYVRSVDESKALDVNHVPKVIISASGMATGGRVLHHIKRFAPDNRNSILFAGFQAPGTRGDAMVNGAEEVKIHGQMVPIRADVDNLSELSAHADEDDLIAWLSTLDAAPRRVFINHGGRESAESLGRRIERDLGWRWHVPEDGERIDLAG